eukprot:4049092-Amphidinium_carterae.1
MFPNSFRFSWTVNISYHISYAWGGGCGGASGAGFVRQDGTILFNDYYHLCAPTTCEWTEDVLASKLSWRLSALVSSV